MTRMGEFQGLEGVEGAIDYFGKDQFFKSVSAGIRLLKTKYKAMMSSGDHGSITIWIDDAGKYRGAFSRWQVTSGHVVCSTKKELSEWLKEWIPRQHTDS